LHHPDGAARAQRVLRPWRSPRRRPAVAAQRNAAMRDLLTMLQREVDAFGQGAPQDDDMTAVLVRREARS